MILHLGRRGPAGVAGPERAPLVVGPGVGRPVLRGVNLEVPQGCLYGLIGPGASGKSLTLKIIAGLVADGQKTGEFDPEAPAPVVARAIFGMLDELALAWLLGRGEKFDMVRAASALSSGTAADGRRPSRRACSSKTR